VSDATDQSQPDQEAPDQSELDQGARDRDKPDQGQSDQGTPDQSETVALLSRQAGSAPVETHISYVFVGPDTVWKLKKAVRLPFLDFTSLAARHRFCVRELELNSAAAPGLYRDVIPVLRLPAGTLVLADDAPRVPDGGRVSPAHSTGSQDIGGEIIDWVVRMARVPASDFLDVRAKAHDLSPALLDQIADAVAEFHLALPPVPGVQPNMDAIAAGNVRSALTAGLPEAEVNRWHDAMRAELAARAVWREARAAGGFVRRCHGDLHLGNLCLWHGRPVPFDALEFDEAMGRIDVAYDLAFLLMDLEHRLDRAAANRVLNRYVARTGDADLVAGLPAFLSMRAMVRAHVEARSGHPGQIDAYLASASDYLTPAAPVVIAIGGLPGTGKSTLARALAPTIGAAPGALILRSDEIRKRQHGVPPEQRLPRSSYTKRKSVAVFEELARMVEVAAKGGHAVIADATFIDPAHRAMAQTAARRAGTRFLGVWLTAPRTVLEQRIAGRLGDASDATVGVLRATLANDPGAGAWHAVDAVDGPAARAEVIRLMETM
jgi:uncharacterized protein